MPEIYAGAFEMSKCDDKLQNKLHSRLKKYIKNKDSSKISLLMDT